MHPENIVPFDTVLKSGFMRTACIKDQLFEEGDKFGKNKYSYTLKSLNVSIVRYTEHVPVEDRAPMTPELCFMFCRTIPKMNYFGITHGRDCYCEPFFTPMADDSSQCDAVCAGDPTQLCGGQSKSTIFSMHNCGSENVVKELNEAMTEAKVSSMELDMSTHAVVMLSKSMQEQADMLQEALGAAGDSVASELMQKAKVFAGKLESAGTKGTRVNATVTAAMSTLEEKMQALAADPSDFGLATDAEKSADAAKSTGADAMETAKEQQALIALAHPGFSSKYTGAAKQYYPAMYFVDKAFVDFPVTCSGKLASEPIVGLSHDECAMACDDKGIGCVGFSYFRSQLCFLFSKLEHATYYTGCGAQPAGVQVAECEVKFATFNGGTLKPDPSGKCKACLTSATQANRCPAFKWKGSVVPPPPTPPPSTTTTTPSKESTPTPPPPPKPTPILINPEAFAKGTLQIKDTGVYKLTADITFEPMSDAGSLFPDPASLEYPQTGGFFLGFFAAVTIAADNVVFDCDGHTMKMSENFYRFQRFFALIELASKPFISQVGPPQFANPILSPGVLRTANNVSILNCKFGLSSHHAIHGNENDGVLLKDLTMADFEVGGIALNGASNVRIESVDIGPSLPLVFPAELSHVMFLDHLMNTLLSSVPELYQKRYTTSLTLAGKEVTVDEVFDKIRTAVKNYQPSEGEPLKSFLGEKVPPDGSAVYGIVLNHQGPAVADFGACPMAELNEEDTWEDNVVIKDVTIHDLALKAEQWTRLVVDGKQVMGPAGDVFRFMMTKSPEDQYVGNILSDAQVAVGVFKKRLLADGMSAEEIVWYFGGSHMPDSVIDWAAAGNKTWDKSLGTFQCFGDAMSHVNKGTMGIRMEAHRNVTLVNAKVSGLSNAGADEADGNFCSQETASNGRPYQGKDVYGAIFTNCLDVNHTGLTVEDGTLSSTHGGTVTPLEERVV